MPGMHFRAHQIVSKLISFEGGIQNTLFTRAEKLRERDNGTGAQTGNTIRPTLRQQMRNAIAVANNANVLASDVFTDKLLLNTRKVAVLIVLSGFVPEAE